MNEYLLLFAVVFAINLMPAFGPPTWSVIVMFGISSNLPLVGLVLTGAFAAALGRYLLAHGFRLLANYVSQKTKANLAAARAAFERRSHRGILALGLFALSPVPSAQLFAAIGLAGVRIFPFTLAFFSGRLVSYSIYASSAAVIEKYTLSDAFMDGLTSPIGIGLQVLMLAGLVALARVDWAKYFGPPEEAPETPAKD
ncbi:hypothetical protein GCM10009127_09160 [Alteraurantiacibacter aestuarii]|uniref:DedA family protein n=1 Tax=Alteraurantiacibacter aestuarii TaxID=650004 RepID=A0A844ZIB1_9SPHN|nr:hypothetical protein [Alteraurantiacibacter aestuarii]MXO87304.1 hypothetical protein [Alteraurantiacibacter aestuarii]